jgi:fructokinase
VAVIALNAEGHPDYTFYRQGVADRQITAQSLSAACRGQAHMEVACTGCLALDPADAIHYLPWLQSQKREGKWIVLDVNLRPSVMPDLRSYRAHVLEMAKLADVLKASDEDLRHLQIPGVSPLDQAMNLMAMTSAQWMALTLGPEGACLLVRHGADVQVLKAREALAVKVIDTVGAGDSFLAGLLACALHHVDQEKSKPLLRKWAEQATLDTLQDVLEHALASATLVVMRRGCEPASWTEVRARMKAFPAI